MMRLADVEAELLRHAQAEKRRWQHIAKLLMDVEQERLWEGHAASFTAWIQGMARRSDLQESMFWRCLKAGRLYLELTGSDALDASEALSAESLELADKIRRHAPKAVTDQVLARTLEGELSRTELRDVWATYKPAAGGATARGRLPTDPEERDEALAARQATWQARKRQPENRSEVRRGEMLASFREGTWLGPFDQARAETRLSSAGGRQAAVLTVRRDARDPERIEIHGLWTCVVEPELADFEFKARAGTDFMWLAVTPEISRRALAKAPHMVGILELMPNRTLRVGREAQRRPVNAQARLELLGELLQRAYLWP
ncbi:MAG: hypothetical protein QM778_04650 [Myxococcales bacterium]